MVRTGEGAKRILVVDDSVTMRAMLSDMFVDRKGFTLVGVAKDADDALRLVEDERPDIVILDLFMPYIDGSRLLTMLEPHPRLMKVVLSSSAAASSDAMRETLFERGADAFYDKADVARDPEGFRDRLATLRQRRGGARQPDGASASNVIDAVDRFPVPHDEQARLASLAALDIVNLDRDPCLDIIVRHLADKTGFPIVAINLIDSSQEWIKAAVGIERRAHPREYSICTHTLCRDGPLIIADTLANRTVYRLPAVVGAPHVRAYAGARIVSKGGVTIGVICVADTRPRRASKAEIASLTEAAMLTAQFLESVRPDAMRAA